ncbi:RNA polymerase sigma factor [Algibacter lectus]|uniref:RNA polymerase sigma factor n=1 Tax=Algibacter lectus TaxID=221126 RepID=UPI0026F14665|nr:sigma-70 family RNA polymerase sigma factor [Algibacter lectus]MDO7136399.1 sigma-70 family RNA polymerase sigma factor [Algibacter lectus]
MERIETIYKNYVDDLYAYGLHLGFSASSVMDAIHNVFQKLLLNKNLSYADNAKPYLLKSVRNELLDEYKRSKKFLSYETDIEILPFNLDVNVEDVLLEKESKSFLKTKIDTALKSLTPRQREIIYLRYTQDYNYQQISEILNITVPACRNLILKALKYLRKNNAGEFYLFLSCGSS